MKKNTVMKMYDAMLAAAGPRHWWPAETPFEVCVGAILTQNTAWSNVCRAIDNLRATDALSLARLHAMPVETLASLIVPAGYYNVKARRLRNFTQMVHDDFGGNLESLLALDMLPMRDKLLSVNGIGRETADCMILYAAGKPVFVVDAYTRRIGSRHGLFAPDADYETMREYFTRSVPRDVAVYNEYHALIVFTGHHWCRRTPVCEGCPLTAFSRCQAP